MLQNAPNPSENPKSPRQVPGRPRLTNFAVVLDTNVLADSEVRDVCLSAAEHCLFRPIWSQDIMNEMRCVLLGFGITDERVDRLIRRMDAAFPEAMVDGYEDLIDAMTCDKKDRHVLAAAIVGGAQLIVTEDLGDFPSESTRKYGIDAVSPDHFLCDLLSLDHNSMLEALSGMAQRRQKPPKTIPDIIEALRARGCEEFARQATVVVESFFGKQN